MTRFWHGGSGEWLAPGDDIMVRATIKSITLDGEWPHMIITFDLDGGVLDSENRESSIGMGAVEGTEPAREDYPLET